MSIRITALCIFVLFLCIYAWKDWFKSLCGLILLMAVNQHESMPTTMFGIQGLNMWNILFLGTFLAWAVSRRREGLIWDMPRYITMLLLMYLAVIVLGVLRAAFDRSHLEGYPLKSLFSEELINCIKWVLPGILLFDGCRTRRRVKIAIVCLLVMYCLIAAQVINRMPFESAFGGSDEIGNIRQSVCSDIGYSACDLSTFLAGASWGLLAVLPLIRQKKYWAIVLGAAGAVGFGQALTGGRAGYLAWGTTGLVLCLLKWRKYLIFAPVVVLLLSLIFTGATERILTGFGETDVTGQEVINDYNITSGRMLIWPYVIDKIIESPIVGYGRLGMKRTGLANQLMTELGESFAHPHNLYLEVLLDNGILGSIPIVIFWGTMLLYSVRLFRSDNQLFSAVGGLSLSLILAQLIAGIGSQHYYPRESTVGMWTAMFLASRVYLEDRRAQISQL